jgi:hypothetical protein
MRWTFRHLHLVFWETDVMLCPLVDLGRPALFGAGESDAPSHLHSSEGLGLRLELDRSFVARMDVAVGQEYVP